MTATASPSVYPKVDLSVFLLSLALLLVIVSILQPLADRLAVPHTVLLAAVGVLIGIVSVLLGSGFPGPGSPGAVIPASSPGDMVAGFRLTSETFLVVFLPLLLFQAALTIDVRRMAEDAAPILLMAIVAVLITTIVVGMALWPVSGLPLVACLLLGAIVATTDPSAVVGIFRDLGAPARLTRLVEGESLLNDAAAIVLFTIFLDLLLLGRQVDAGGALITFVISFVGGAAVGVAGARLIAFLIRFLRDLRLAEVTMTLALPYIVYIVSNDYLGVSGVVAAVAAGLALSATGRGRIAPENWRFLQDIWQQLGFWASSLVFVLAAILMPGLIADIGPWDVLLLAIVIIGALAARAVVLFGFLPLLSVMRLSQSVDRPLTIVILWGGLRGAVTIALALGVTENRFIDDEVQRFVAIMSTGFVLFTLFGNGITLKPMIRRLHLDRLSPIDRVLREQVLALALSNVRDSIRRTATQYQIPRNIARDVIRPYETRIKNATEGQSIEDQIADRDRITIGLVALANRERELILAHYQQRTVSSVIVEPLMAYAGHLADSARAQGRIGYNRAARRMLAFPFQFRMAEFIHRRLGYARPLVTQLTLRFEMQLLSQLVLDELQSFGRSRLPPLLGDRVAEIVEDMLATRLDHVEQALDALRLQYPSYAESLERRFLRRFALRLEEVEYQVLRDEALIGQELYFHLRSEVESDRTRSDALPPLDLALNTRDLVRQFPLFAHLSDEQIEVIATQLEARFASPGSWLIRRGQKSDSVYFIASGAVEVTIEDSDQSVRLGRGDFFGEMAILSGRRRRSDVRSLGFCHLLVLNDTTFRRLLDHNPDIRSEIDRIVSIRSQMSQPQPSPETGPKSS